MNLLSNIWEAIKRYPYKLWTSILILAVCVLLEKEINCKFIPILEYVIFGGLSFYILSAFYAGVKHTWNDGDKTEAIVFGLLGIVMIAFSSYFLFFR